MRGQSHDYNRCTTPEQTRRKWQKNIIEEVENKIAKLSIKQLSSFYDEIYKIDTSKYSM